MKTFRNEKMQNKMVLTSYPQENSPVCKKKKKKIILAMSNYDTPAAREADNNTALRALTLADEHC